MEQNPERHPRTCGHLVFDKVARNTQLRKDGLFNKWCWENKLDSHMQKNEAGPLSHTIHKTQLTMK